MRLITMPPSKPPLNHMSIDHNKKKTKHLMYW